MSLLITGAEAKDVESKVSKVPWIYFASIN